MTYNRFIISRLVAVIAVVASNTINPSAIDVEQSSVQPDGKEGNTNKQCLPTCFDDVMLHSSSVPGDSPLLRQVWGPGVSSGDVDAR